jgi:pimeloyl-ACP methyl ester carboxylesterase
VGEDVSEMIAMRRGGGEMATFVLVHGGWDGGWAWRSVARELQAAGHEVFTPTLTGSGERVHLASPEIGLETHVLDIVNVLRYENLHDVILVGISGGGMAITGTAERVPERIGHLIYLDAFVPQDGQSIADMLGPELASGLEQRAQVHGGGWRVPHDPPDADRRTDVMLNMMKQPLAVTSQAAAQLRRTYVLHTGKPADSWLTPVFGRIASRVREEEGWNYCERPFEHWPLLDRSHEVALLLLELAQ